MNTLSSSAGRIAALSLLVGVATAQTGQDLLSSLSSGCQEAAGSLVAGDFANCAAVNNLISVITADGSIVQPLNDWAVALCDKPPCADDVVQAAAGRVEEGCATDIQQGNVAAFALQTITTNFDDVKSLVCLQSSDNSTSCLTNFLTNVEADTGTQLTTDNLQSIASADGIQQILGQLPPEHLCTDCNSAELFTLKGTSILPQGQVDQLNSVSTGQCGADFGTSVPSSVESAQEGSSGRLAVGSSLALVAAALSALAF